MFRCESPRDFNRTMKESAYGRLIMEEALIDFDPA
jgi:hypothetical protein